MSPNDQKKSGGITFGNVGGNVTVSAGGDVVGGDKVTTTVFKGFANEDARKQFGEQIEELRLALHEFKAGVEASPDLTAGEKEDVTAEVVAHTRALEELKETTEGTPVDAPASEDLVSRVEETLTRASGFIGIAEGLAEKAKSFVEMVASFTAKYAPLLLSARRLFGLM